VLLTRSRVGRPRGAVLDYSRTSALDAQVDGETESAEFIPGRRLDSAAMTDVMSSAIEPAPAMMTSVCQLPYGTERLAPTSTIRRCALNLPLSERTGNTTQSCIVRQKVAKIRSVGSLRAIETDCMVHFVVTTQLIVAILWH
jgi:hypothetical protein